MRKGTGFIIFLRKTLIKPFSNVIIIRHLIDSLVMDIDSIQDAEIERMRIALARMEGKNKRKSAKGSFSVKKKLRVAPTTKRMRSTGVTPRTAKKADTRTSRSRQMQPRKLFGSGTNSRSGSRPPLSQQGKMEQFLKGNKAMYNLLTSSSKKKISFATTLKSRKVRHKNARTVLKKMPAGGKPYARGRKSMKKPKGAYRGAVMPRWAKGETKHILMNDNCSDVDPEALSSVTTSPFDSHGDETKLDIGELKAWSLNPCIQGNGAKERNGRSIDGTYLRIQGHIRNSSVANATPTQTEGRKAYVRMLVLACKGQGATSTSAAAQGTAKFLKSQMFKKINGDVVGFDSAETAGSVTAGSGVARVRSLQLPINKQLYTVLADQKFQLANAGESFGSSDRLFDFKMPLKQRTTFSGASDYASFEKNQLVFVVYSADPACADSKGTDLLPIEFESKYSYKDF